MNRFLLVILCLLLPTTVFCTESPKKYLYTIHMDVQRCKMNPSAIESLLNDTECVRYYPDINIIACSVDDAMMNARAQFEGWKILGIQLIEVKEIDKGGE